MSAHERSVSLPVALLPLLLLIVLLALNVYLFGDAAIGGPSQVVLIFCAALAALLARQRELGWHELEQGIVHGIRLATPAILILLMVGALSGAWLVSGIIPTLIHYGLQLLNPHIFLLAACFICALVSMFTGSSWTTSATIGIALVGVGKVLGLHEGMIAGAIISGAYFGDKLSPLSDTTNLASAAAGVDLFTHVRYMCYTTVPSMGLALLLFGLLGLGANDGVSGGDIDAIQQLLGQHFAITPLLLLVPALVIAMILKRVPALPALFIGTLAGVLCALLLQSAVLREIGAANRDGAAEYSVYVGVLQSLHGDVQIHTDNAVLDELLSSGGMAGMLSTIWLIISAMIFGGVMEASGFLQRITQAMLNAVRSTLGLVATTAGTCLFTNLTTADQYLSVLLPGRMFRDSYRRRGLAPQNLSRTLEDAGTVTSVLVPWNTCGAYHASVLGVATFTYLPFAFFCLISPFMTLLFAAANLRIARLDEADQQTAVA